MSLLFYLINLYDIYHHFHHITYFRRPQAFFLFILQLVNTQLYVLAINLS
jgi:hypothetical protein